MSEYFAYIRVSDPKQERGVSLDQQRDDIERYAARQSIALGRWFIDVETAAKAGRRQFTEMVKLLRARKAAGVVFHKIDRSMRNRTEWAHLNDLFDCGIDVRFAHEGVDMHTRSGRVAADVQAALAVAYIANLRDEVIKGMWGRLKQGLYPWQAPPGYGNNGEGKAKTIDPVQGPLARQAFELYASGRYTLRTLAAEMARRGLRHLYKEREVKVSKDGIGAMLRNPFYIGVIEVKRTGETFAGTHEPLVSRGLFDEVQRLLDGKSHAKVQRHNFTFRRMVPCPQCGRNLIGERQKDRYTYYRCHSPSCKLCLREEVLHEAVCEALERLRFSEDEKAYLKARLPLVLKRLGREERSTKDTLKLELGQMKDRLMRLTDAFIDGMIDKALFEGRKRALLLDQQRIEEALSGREVARDEAEAKVRFYLELAGDALLSYGMASVDEQRELLRQLTSNWRLEPQRAYVELRSPFREIAERSSVQDGPQKPAKPRRRAKVTAAVTCPQEPAKPRRRAEVTCAATAASQRVRTRISDKQKNTMHRASSQVAETCDRLLEWLLMWAASSNLSDCSSLASGVATQSIAS